MQKNLFGSIKLHKPTPAFTLLEFLIALFITASILAFSSTLLNQVLRSGHAMEDQAYLKDQASYALEVMERDLSQALYLEEPTKEGEFLVFHVAEFHTRNNELEWEKTETKLISYSLQGMSHGRKQEFKRMKEGAWQDRKQPVAQFYRAQQEGDRAYIKVYYYDQQHLPTVDLDQVRYVRVFLRIEPKDGECFELHKDFHLESRAFLERGKT